MSLFNTNQFPYFDDFDPQKNHFSVLFNPGRPVQVRELNQLQSIQHYNLEQFANSIFKNGSLVSGGSVAVYESNFVIIDDVPLVSSSGDKATVNVNPSAFNYGYLRGRNKLVEAEIIMCSNSSPYTVYLNYTKAGTDNVTDSFLVNEIVDIIENDNVLYTVRVLFTDKTSNDKKLFLIPESTYYIGGYFVKVAKTIVVGKQDTLNYEVGLKIQPSIVTHLEDASLFDNTLGYPNKGAPGADRAKITVVPDTRITTAYDPNFIVLVKIIDGVPHYIKKRSEYSNLMDMLAERTYERSGNFTVNKFNISIREHLNFRNNSGVHTESEGGDFSKFVATLSPGKGYVRGYMVETIADTPITMDKANETKKLRNYYSQFTDLSYILVSLKPESYIIPGDGGINTVFGNFITGLYDGSVQKSMPWGNKIGELIPYDIQIHSTKDDTTVYKLFFVKLALKPNKKITDAAIIARTGMNTFLADVVKDDSTTTISSQKTCLLWKINDFLKTLRDVDDNKQLSLSYSLREKFSCYLDIDGCYTWNSPSGVYYKNYNYFRTIGCIVLPNGTGSTLDLTNTLTITPVKMTVNLGKDYAGKHLVILHDVLKSNVMEKKKTLRTNVEIITVPTGDKKFLLDKIDAFKVISLKKGTITLEPNRYSLNTGQTDYSYENGFIELAEPSEGGAYTVEYSYFEHGSGDFFSVDSYKELIDAPGYDFIRDDIGSYLDSQRNLYQLADCVDFRPAITGNTPVQAKTVMMLGDITTDAEIYLPRIDYIAINHLGEIIQKKGVPAEYPRPPEMPTDDYEMALYEIHQRPIVGNVINDIRYRIVENQRYTMQDIGKIESRIDKIEYYTSFSLMEMTLADANILDEFGFNRFKNGFISDNFVNFQASDQTSSEFRCSLDKKNGILRPPYFMTDINFQVNFDKSNNCRTFGDVIMADFMSESFISQPYGNQIKQINQRFITNKIGQMVLIPPFDTWASTTELPNVVLDFQTPPANSSATLGTSWGDWTNVSISTVNLGNRITDTRLIPYMRPISIEFYAVGLIPDSVYKCYFDDIDVSQYCRNLTSSPGRMDASVSTSIGAYGEDVRSNLDGVVHGEFAVPDKKFFTGEKLFKLFNKNIGTVNAAAQQAFWSGGINYSKEQTTMRVVTPIVAGYGAIPVMPLYRPVPTTTSGAVGDVDESIYQVFPDLPSSNLSITNTVNPLAQTFYNEISCFLTSCGLFFNNALSFDTGIEVLVAEVNNGVPTNTILGQFHVDASTIVLNAEFVAEFPYPIYLEGNKQYAIILLANESTTSVTVAGIGENDPVLGTIAPAFNVGSFFRSVNNSFWELEKNTALKFNLYRARFKSDKMVVQFDNKTFEDTQIVISSIQTTAGSDYLTFYSNTHALSVGDVFMPVFSEGCWITFSESTVYPLSIGQQFTTVTGSGTVVAIKYDAGVKQCLLYRITGYFIDGQAFIAPEKFIDLDTYVLRSFFNVLTTRTLSESRGTIIHSTVENRTVNGIPISEITKPLVVVDFNGYGGVVAKVAIKATTSGFIEESFILNTNRRLDGFVISGNVVSNGNDYNLVSAGYCYPINGLFEETRDVRVEFPVLFNEVKELDRPLKLATALNSANPTFSLMGEFNVAPYSSPIININEFLMVGISNQISSHSSTIYFVPETDPSMGSNAFKYVTQVVSLISPAFDAKIYLDVYKPDNSDFDIYIKYNEPYENTDIDSKNWILLNAPWKNFICSKNEYREIEINLSTDNTTIFDGTFSFDKIKLKIVGQSKNTSDPILFKQFRVIALT